MSNKKKKTVIFDLDGTIYSFKNGSYATSGLRKHIMSNAVLYIKEKLKISKKEARGILNMITNKYKQEISIGLEKELGFNRYEYFNTVWNINPKILMIPPRNLRKNLLKVKENYKILLLSDAPKIWIKNVLDYLYIDDLFKNKIISGEGSVRKGFGNAFSTIIKNYKLKAEECIVVGDQEKTDIIPAKNLGMKTIFINSKQKSSYANFSVGNISQALKMLNTNSLK